MQEQLARITNLQDVNRLLHDVVAQERACDAELDAMLRKRGELELSILALNATTTEALDLVRADSEQLLGALQPTAVAADAIGGRVRALDAAAGRVRGALELMDLILDRSGCVTGVQAALAAGDYEGAAGHVAAFLALERRLAAAPRALADDTGQVEEQRQLLLAAKARLEGVVAARLEEAAAARDRAGVLRFAKLHAPLGNPQAGLARYIAFTRLTAGARARDSYAALCDALDAAPGPKAKAPDFVGAATGLFRDLALAAEQDEREVAAAFGPAAVADVVLAVQAECDTQGLRLLQRFLEARRVPAVAADAARRGSGGEGPDPRAVEPLVQEIVVLVQRSEEYNAFMVAKMRSAIAEHFSQQQQQQQGEQQQQQQLAAAAHRQPANGAGAQGGGGGDQQRPQRQHSEGGALARRTSLGAGEGKGGGAAGGGGLPPELAAQAAAAAAAAEAKFRGGAFNVCVRELVGHYMALEEYYLEATTAMAIRIDAAVAGVLTSSMVDDVFYIAKKCGARALATGSVQCAAALLGASNDALANAYRAALQSRLSGGPSRLAAASPTYPAGLPPTLDAAAQAGAAEHAVAVNNADVSADYAAKLRSELEGLAERVFAGTGERERLRSVLSDLSKTGGDFRALAARAAEGVADALLPRLRGVLEEVGQAGYLLGDGDYQGGGGGGGGEDSWVARLLAALDMSVAWLRERLTGSAWEGVFHSLLDKAIARLEVLLGRKQFSQLGGLQLDRDVRALVAATGDMTGRTVRDKFARLTQMATVLSLESVHEFLDYWGDDAGHVTWRLTPAEVRALLAQRPDFSRDAIDALPL